MCYTKIAICFIVSPLFCCINTNLCYVNRTNFSYIKICQHAPHFPSTHIVRTYHHPTTLQDPKLQGNTPRNGVVSAAHLSIFFTKNIRWLCIPVTGHITMELLVFMSLTVLTFVANRQIKMLIRSMNHINISICIYFSIKWHTIASAGISAIQVVVKPLTQCTWGMASPILDMPSCFFSLF